ncbi:MAG: hypothetical protein SPJ89_02850 [Treponema sp.]|nr:hypothetical protein [Spirochaetia bacterium]MDD7460136.1 hypothetical protein [Spirochaetales bacterium]MDY5810899.1 hypothetical protein [Treponema sp.]
MANDCNFSVKVVGKEEDAGIELNHFMLDCPVYDKDDLKQILAWEKFEENYNDLGSSDKEQIDSAARNIVSKNLWKYEI